MFTFGNRYLRIASILIILYAGYNSYRNTIHFSSTDNYNATKPQSIHSISIDKSKDPSQYTLWEKCLYYFFHENIDKERNRYLETLAAEKADAIAKTNARLQSENIVDSNKISDSSNTDIASEQNNKILSPPTSVVKNDSIILLTIALPSGIVMAKLNMQSTNQEWVDAIDQSLQDIDIVALKNSLAGAKIGEYKSIKLSVADKSVDFVVGAIDPRDG